MKVFKFYCGEIYYVFAAKTKELAIEEFTEQTGDLYTVCEEIQESEWDKKDISVYEDNNLVVKPDKVSIRQMILGTYPQMICTNDITRF